MELYNDGRQVSDGINLFIVYSDILLYRGLVPFGAFGGAALGVSAGDGGATLLMEFLQPA